MKHLKVKTFFATVFLFACQCWKTSVPYFLMTIWINKFAICNNSNNNIEVTTHQGHVDLHLTFVCFSIFDFLKLVFHLQMVAFKYCRDFSSRSLLHYFEFSENSILTLIDVFKRGKIGFVFSPEGTNLHFRERKKNRGNQRKREGERVCVGLCEKGSKREWERERKRKAKQIRKQFHREQHAPINVGTQEKTI